MARGFLLASSPGPQAPPSRHTGRRARTARRGSASRTGERGRGRQRKGGVSFQACARPAALQLRRTRHSVQRILLLPACAQPAQGVYDRQKL